jgi:pimeloyl-ACP methyl ester carboxylesterase
MFTYSSNDSWEHMTKHKFMDFCADVWTKAALAHVLGHSFRIGGAVALLLAGVSPEVVAATGGWTSLAFLLYWRRMEEILPMSTSRAYQRSHVDELVKIFEKFRVDNHIPSNFVTFHDRVEIL